MSYQVLWIFTARRPNWQAIQSLCKVIEKRRDQFETPCRFAVSVDDVLRPALAPDYLARFIEGLRLQQISDRKKLTNLVALFDRARNFDILL